MEESLPLDSLLSFLEEYQGATTEISADAVEQLKGLLMKYMQDSDEIKILTDKVNAQNKQITELNEAVKFLSSSNNFSAGGDISDEHIGTDSESIQHQLMTNKIITENFAHQGIDTVDEQAPLERKILSKWNMKIKSNEKVLEEEIARLKQQQEGLSVLNQQLQSQLSVVAQDRDELTRDLKASQSNLSEE